MSATTPKRTTLAKLEAARSRRPLGYVDAILAAGRYDPDGIHHHIEASTLLAIRARFGVDRGAHAPRVSTDAPSHPHRPVENPLPSLFQQARNAGAAAARSARALAAGQPLRASADAIVARLLICEVCPEYRPSDHRCAKCGCKLRGKLANKLALAAESCPLGKWTAEISTPANQPS